MDGMDAAIDRAVEARNRGEVLSIGVRCNAVDLLERLIARNIIPDTLTDQTSAHDPLIGYWPHELSYEQAKVLRQDNPKQYIEHAYRSMYRHVECMLELQRRGAVTFDYGNNLRARAQEKGLKNRLTSPDLSRLISGPCSVKGRDRSGGRPSAAIRPISR